VRWVGLIIVVNYKKIDDFIEFDLCEWADDNQRIAHMSREIEEADD
jgi:hypothetical protein